MSELPNQPPPMARRTALAKLTALGVVGVFLGAKASRAEQVGSVALDDQNAIMSLLVAYATALDEGRIEDCAALFEVAEFTIENVATVQGSQGVSELFSGIILYEDGTPRTKHVITIVDIKVLENGRSALASSYLTVFQQVDEAPLQPVFSGAYSDTFDKSDGTWRFTTREVSGALFGDMSRHLENPPN